MNRVAINFIAVTMLFSGCATPHELPPIPIVRHAPAKRDNVVAAIHAAALEFGFKAGADGVLERPLIAGNDWLTGTRVTLDLLMLMVPVECVESDNGTLVTATPYVRSKGFGARNERVEPGSKWSAEVSMLLDNAIARAANQASLPMQAGTISK